MVKDPASIKKLFTSLEGVMGRGSEIAEKDLEEDEAYKESCERARLARLGQFKYPANWKFN